MIARCRKSSVVKLGVLISVYIGFLFLFRVYKHTSTRTTSDCHASEVHVCYAVNRINADFCTSLRSSIINNLQPWVAGLGEVSLDPKWNKTLQFAECAVAVYRHSPNAVVMFVDSFDTLFQMPDTHVKQNFCPISSKIIYSAETSCWPAIYLKVHKPHNLSSTTFGFKASAFAYPYNTEICNVQERKGAVHYGGDLSKYRSAPWYVNSGGMIATAEQAVAFYAKAKLLTSSLFIADDQQLAAVMVNIVHSNATLDYNSTFFMSMLGGWGNTELRDGYVHNKITRMRPVVLHFNGLKTNYTTAKEHMWWINTPVNSNALVRLTNGSTLHYSSLCAPLVPSKIPS